MAIVINREEILSIVKNIDVVAEIEKGFIEYSNNNCVVPPIGELLFEKNNGETHIKYGYIKNQPYYVIKISSGFYNNPQINLPSSQGLMLVLSQKTGQTKAVLLDDGELTNIRTAATGALIAKYFAPKNIKAIGIIGTGTQGQLQLQYLQKETTCREVWIWDINEDNAQKYKLNFSGEFNINIADSVSEVAEKCNFIVTTTPSTNSLLKLEDIQRGTHITAVGSDTPEKQELDSQILAKAEIIISDSIEQSKSRGEVYHAVNKGYISRNEVTELGLAVQDKNHQRQTDEQLTIADLTGVAVQDIMIAQSVYNNLIK